MRIRRSSWHFRLYARYARFFEFEPRPKNLCRYFWTITVLTSCFIVFGPVIVIVLGLAYCIAWPIMEYRDSDFRRRRKAAKWRRLLESGKADKPREPSLLATYLRARKAKVCPLITIVDDVAKTEAPAPLEEEIAGASE